MKSLSHLLLPNSQSASLSQPRRKTCIASTSNARKCSTNPQFKAYIYLIYDTAVKRYVLIMNEYTRFAMPIYSWSALRMKLCPVGPMLELLFPLTTVPHHDIRKRDRSDYSTRNVKKPVVEKKSKSSMKRFHKANNIPFLKFTSSCLRTDIDCLNFRSTDGKSDCKSFNFTESFHSCFRDLNCIWNVSQLFQLP